MASTLKPRTEKLPLTVKKNIRDDYESKREGYEKQISDALGEKWTIEVDFNQVYPYVDDSYAPRVGSMVSEYMKSLVQNTKEFAKTFGDDGKQELNSTCSQHKIVFGPQEDTTFKYGGFVVKNNELHLVFAENAFPVNVSDVSRDFAKALATASASTGSAYNIVARNSVRQRYDPKIESTHKDVVKLLNNPDIKLNPNFEAVSVELAKSGPSDWQERLGYLGLSYFQGFAYALRNNKFQDDDMLQEGFQEAVTKNEVCLRVFQEWPDKSSRYNEAVIEDGVLYIQTIVKNWGSNVNDAALKITDLL